jgi:hypothetical protein
LLQHLLDLLDFGQEAQPLAVMTKARAAMAAISLNMGRTVNEGLNL